MSKHDALKKALALVFQGIEQLNKSFPNRKFTIDGRLVGDIGEIIAELEYDIILDEVSQATYDGTTSDGRRVQVKATFQNSLTFKTTPDYLLGFKLFQDGSYEEIYNGPGRLIQEKYAHRKGLGSTLLSFPNTALSELSKNISDNDRIAKKNLLAAPP
jgi:hypothetical protein